MPQGPRPVPGLPKDPQRRPREGEGGARDRARLRRELRLKLRNGLLCTLAVEWGMGNVSPHRVEIIGINV